MSLRILLVEDDKGLRDTLRTALQVQGFDMTTAASLSEAQALLRNAGAQSGFDLLLLDLGLPDGDGGALLALARKQGPIPVIVLSARPGETSKIELLDAGADDYLVKPFGVGELLARIRVALRHRGTHLQAAVLQYTHGDMAVDVQAHTVTRSGQAVHLTPTEFKLLARLVRNAGQVVTHRQLLLDVWGPEYVDHLQYLRLYMGQLRAKLEQDPATPERLLTEPGVGYRLVESQR